MTNGWTFDLYAIAFAALVCGVCGVILLVQDYRARHRKRPWDWQVDGECDNASKPRIVA